MDHSHVSETDTQPESPSSPRAGRTPTGVILAAVFTVFASGLGIGWLVRPVEPAEVATAAPTTTVSPTTTQASTETAPTVELPDVVVDPATDGLVDGSSTEPIADVAEAVLPAVVEIQLGQAGVGSGVVFDTDGLILTAAHVVDGFDSVQVVLSTGDRIVGTVLGVDVANDIAVVSIDEDGVPAAPLALDQHTRAGQTAIALGSPWGLDSTVTAGIVSSPNQVIGAEVNDPRLMLQTDASINPGNSGGPLVDAQGRVIGINVSIFSTSGANDGVGFAVPIDRAYRAALAILSGGIYEQGLLGVTVTATDSGQAGTTVTELTPSSGAADAGIQVGDIIIRVDDTPIPSSDVLGAVIRNYEAGDVVSVELVRGGRTIVLEATLGGRSDLP